ncbi:MAG: GNAT family N-acetyltransferase [Anaerolineales bacterium]|nr:GNAT family N-acetyltransferase [Anaerolineales bacterium]
MAEHKRLSRDDVEFRKARAEDRPSIERIAAKTWDGEDYLPEVFDGWLQDEAGLFSVMTLQNEVVALSKLSQISPTEWWLEGLRVDAKYRGRGLARIMHHYTVAQARQIADGVLRFSTADENAAVLHLAQESGFHEVARFARYYLHTLAPSLLGEWHQLTAADLSDVQAWLQQSVYFETVQQSLEERWKWYMMTASVLHERLESGQVHVWQPAAGQWGGLAVLNAPHKAGRVTIAYGDALPTYRLSFWQAISDLMQPFTVEEVHVKIVNLPEFTTPLKQAGWEKDEDFQAVLLSRDVVLTKESPVQYEQLPALD